jgi:NOL1/NOP2/fmu family ribosome biogenesis protein
MYLPIKILHTHGKKEIENKLKAQFGINEIPGILLKRGAERIFLYQGKFTKHEIKKLDYMKINVERIGVYFCKFQNDEIRLSIEGTQILKDQITKNIFELNKEQAEQWMKGNELNIDSGFKGFVIMKYKEDLLGCGKASVNKITNFIPKNRRLKEKN